MREPTGSIKHALVTVKRATCLAVRVESGMMTAGGLLEGSTIMAKHHLVFAAVFIALPLPAVAGVTVIGNSSARMCYLATESRSHPDLSALRRCNDALGEAQTLQHDRVATYVNRGILRLRRNDLEGALSDFDAALRLDPTEAEAYINRGSLMLRRNQVEEARVMFSRALEHNTRRPALAHYGRAVAHELLGDLRGAYDDYRRASELDPDWSQPRQELQRFRVVPSSRVGAG